MAGETTGQRPMAETCSRERCYIAEWWNDGSDKAVSIARVRVEPGVRTEPHRLRDINERYLILSGHGRMDVAGRSRNVGPGDVVVIAAGETQCITNTGERDLGFLAVCTPRFRPECYEAITEG